MLIACGDDPVTVPNVTGYRLDDAHNRLKDAGFEKFDDVDAISGRTPMMDSNWVVLVQSPGGDAQADTDGTVRLEIAKPEDDGVRDRIPPDSPVAAEIRSMDERDEEKRRQDTIEQAEDAQNFVDDIDPVARGAQNVIAEFGNLRAVVVESGSVGPMALDTLMSLKHSLETYWEFYEDAPDHVNDDADEVQEAIDKFARAAETLASADSVAAAGALTRFDTLRAEAITQYNRGLANIYRGTTVKPPLL
jgi:hypothetical protein